MSNHISQVGSIRSRLTLFYTVAVFVLLALTAFLLYWVTINFLYKADYEFVEDVADTIQYIVESDQIGSKALKEAILKAPLQPGGSIYHYYIRIYDENKHIIMQTPGSEKALESESYYYKTPELLEKKRYFWYSKNNIDYLLIEAPLKLGTKNKVGLIQVVLNISYQHNIIHDRKKIIALLLAGTLGSLLLGFFIANRGLKSLYLLTETVQKITASSLNQRINPELWPAELTGLGVAFNQMLDRIEASFIRLTQFSSDLSHELRTPITNLIGATEISLSYDHSVTEYQKVMESNLEELQRISSVIENILFLARAENPQLDLVKSPLDAGKEIALVCEFYQAMAEEKNIRVTNFGHATVYANPDMFRRMISNILSNSLKYTPPGGRVRFTVQDLEDDKVKIVLEDNGIGIATEHLPKVFDRFFRIDAARSENSGIGLGLAIVKSIVDVHQGAISIKSEYKKGSSVTIILPKITKL